MKKNGFRLTSTGLKQIKEYLDSKYSKTPIYRLAEIIKVPENNLPESGKNLQISKDTIRRILQLDEKSLSLRKETIEEFANRIGFDLLPNHITSIPELAQDISKYAEYINPFTSRTCMQPPSTFFGRKHELHKMHNSFNFGTGYHIHGESRVGKSSLLRQFAYEIVRSWDTYFAIVDLNDSRTHTQVGILSVIAQSFNFPETPESISDFNNLYVSQFNGNKKYVILFDHFERYSELIASKVEFEFWLNMRWLISQDVIIHTSSTKVLSDIRSISGDYSPLHNVLLPLNLERFSDEETIGFITEMRDGVMPFSEDEVQIIHKYSKCHPLALQVLCYYFLDAKIANSSLTVEKILEQAYSEITLIIKGWENEL